MSFLQPQPNMPGLTQQPQQPVQQTQQVVQSPFAPNQQPMVQPQQIRPTQPQIIQRGVITIFPYQFWKNDPMPCVLVSSINGYEMRGINLHYLTFMDVKRLLVPNPNLTYYIKVVKAFRTYLVRGIMVEKAKIIDAKFLLQMMSMVKSFDPIQVKAIREEIERQLITSYQQPQANPTDPLLQGSITTQQSSAMLDGSANTGLAGNTGQPI